VKHTLSQASYSTFSLEIEPGETRYRSVDEIIAYFRRHIEEHKTAQFIAEFDHYAHTRALPEGQISEDILAAKLLIFCFGISLPDPAHAGHSPALHWRGPDAQGVFHHLPGGPHARGQRRHGGLGQGPVRSRQSWDAASSTQHP
jgi:diadenosine tetraphosphatase ApaH/serine/threonine PP2A family protein phosphatase